MLFLFIEMEVVSFNTTTQKKNYITCLMI
uniref:Uncharacterized protein n=1 Tax=Lepeophtheirus salmonis TaxID=72036 RepID=A0A0K2TDN0_LEPSM